MKIKAFFELINVDIFTIFIDLVLEGKKKKKKYRIWFHLHAVNPETPCMMPVGPIK